MELCVCVKWFTANRMDKEKRRRKNRDRKEERERERKREFGQIWLNKMCLSANLFNTFLY